jgi:hypothetical protein
VVVNVTPAAALPRKRDPVPIVLDPEWAPAPAWTDVESLVLAVTRRTSALRNKDRSTVQTIDDANIGRDSARIKRYLLHPLFLYYMEIRCRNKLSLNFLPYLQRDGVLS